MSLIYTCSLLVAHDSIQLILQTDCKIWSARGLIELKGFIWLYLLQSQKAKFAPLQKTVIGSVLPCYYCCYFLYCCILLDYFPPPIVCEIASGTDIFNLKEKHIYHVDMEIITLKTTSLFAKRKVCWSNIHAWVGLKMLRTQILIYGETVMCYNACHAETRMPSLRKCKYFCDRACMVWKPDWGFSLVTRRVKGTPC